MNVVRAAGGYGKLVFYAANVLAVIVSSYVLLQTRAKIASSPYRYDATIKADSGDIFKDDNALYSYTRKYGTQKTVLHLHKLSADYGDCHQRAHKAGRIAYEIFGDKVFQEGSAECHSGIYHGATEAYFKQYGTSDLKASLNVICNFGTGSFYTHQCLHGIGHGLMAWTGYELYDALKSCDLVDTMRDSCYSGVFMENVVGGLAKEATPEQIAANDGHFTKYLNDDPEYPCNAVDAQYKNSCYFFQTSRMLQIFKGDFSKVAKACSQVPRLYATYCYTSMGRDVSPYYPNKPEGAISTCRVIPDENHFAECLNGVVQDIFWDNTGAEPAIKFCDTIGGDTHIYTCYTIIIQRASEILNEEQKSQFCTKVTSEEREFCRVSLTT